MIPAVPRLKDGARKPFNITLMQNEQQRVIATPAK